MWISRAYSSEVWILILNLYVDDIIIVNNDKNNMAEVRRQLNENSEMIDIGDLKNFLFLEISRNRIAWKLTISQTKYINTMLKRFGLHNCKLRKIRKVSNPVTNKEKKNNGKTSNTNYIVNLIENRNNRIYREGSRSLLYIANGCKRHIAYDCNQ